MNPGQTIALLEPQFRERVWGGQRLKPQQPPIGEIWCAYGDSRIVNGAHAGRSLGELTTAHGASFVGSTVATRFPGRFPLLVKLLDCADWLSVQVHPNDAQAERMHGKGFVGKTEAWHFLEAEPGSMIMAGTRPGTTHADLERAIRTGRVLEVSPSIAVHPGETYLLHAGTMHALGPGLVLYEVQQASDITYRVYDWDRPANAGRELHIEQAVAVTDPQRQAIRTSRAIPSDVSTAVAVESPYFVLDILNVRDEPMTGDTAQRTFHLLTVTSGTVRVTSGNESIEMEKYSTALVVGSAGRYELSAVDGPAVVLRARVPD